ncbi:MAG: hypothetical protein DLM69_00285 [Candidatus Chloroheliales bacterium]|nr:MAG: hypothetical protein DLM69_00285 [Chloroflexota bacterium]
MTVAEALRQLAERAYSIHLIIGTQRRLEELLPTNLRAQLASRVTLRVVDPQASEMIIGMRRAEWLQMPGAGLCVFDGRTLRVQRYFIEPGELLALLRVQER